MWEPDEEFSNREERGRAYTRYQRFRSIKRKKNLSKRVFHCDWFYGVDGKYSKGHIGCGCELCKPGRRSGIPSEAETRKVAICEQDLKEYFSE